MRPEERIAVDLDKSERHLLRCGVVEWGGPARCTEELAVAMGFQGVDDLFTQSRRLIASLEAGEAMTRLDWCRVLLATEIVFASDVVGAGIDWFATTGLSDAESLEILRRIQRKLTGKVRGVIGNGLGTRKSPK